MLFFLASANREVGRMVGKDDQVARLCEQKRSALARAAALRQQLERKAEELNQGAAAERMEATQRLEKLAAGAARVRARCAALEEELRATRSRSRELQQRRERLREECQMRDGDETDSGEMVADALVAFAEGASTLFSDCFAKPIATSANSQTERLRCLPARWGAKMRSAASLPRAVGPAAATLAEAETLLVAYARLLEETPDGRGWTTCISPAEGTPEAALEPLSDLASLLAATSRWQRDVVRPQAIRVGAAPVGLWNRGGLDAPDHFETSEASCRRQHSSRSARSSAIGRPAGDPWSARSV